MKRIIRVLALSLYWAYGGTQMIHIEQFFSEIAVIRNWKHSNLDKNTSLLFKEWGFIYTWFILIQIYYISYGLSL